MSIESPFVRVSDLVATNPAGGDGRSTADDHMRGIKAVLKGTAQRIPGMEAISELTLDSNGAIVPTVGIHTVDTESDDATDNLDTITATNFLSGALLMLAVENASRVVTIRHGEDNIVTADGNDIVLDDIAVFVLLRYDGANWNVVQLAIGSLSLSSITTDTVNEKTTGAGVGVDSVVGSATAGTGEVLHTKVIAIGDWNMDSTLSVNVAHGLTLSKIRGISAVIRNDAATGHSNFGGTNASDLGTGFLDSNATNIVLTRTAFGTYDNSAFDSTSFNRGWITIIYAT